jgi:hypothetical protein
MNANVLAHYAVKAGCEDSGRWVASIWVLSECTDMTNGTMVRLVGERLSSINGLCHIANSLIESGHCKQWCMEFQGANGIEWECWQKAYNRLVVRYDGLLLATGNPDNPYDNETDEALGSLGKL